LTLRQKIISIIIAVIVLVTLIIAILVVKFGNKDQRPEIDDRELSIKILNGCGIPGLARDYENYLKEKYAGYENTFFKFSEPSNARKYIYNKSVIVVSQDLDENQNPNNLQVLIDRTGIENWTYAVDKVELPDYQFLIILGRDFQNIMK
jgi:hypothetical protein